AGPDRRRWRQSRRQDSRTLGTFPYWRRGHHLRRSSVWRFTNHGPARPRARAASAALFVRRQNDQRSFGLRCGSAAWRPWWRHHVLILRVGRRLLLDARIHFFWVNDAVRLVQLFAQILARSGVERHRWTRIG